MNVHDFGNSFKWGVATSAYQSEGAYLDDFKGLSIWDVFADIPGKIADNKNAHTSCDFYNHYMQDIILMHYLNIENFRFSISWPRIFPDGIGNANPKGLDFYDRLVDFCLEMGIEPWITLYHWDLPQALQQKGGWTNREILNWFSQYVEICALRYGDRVKNWMVLNEPLVFTGAGYFLGVHAPGKKGFSNFLPAAHHAVLCQALGARVLKSVQQGLHVGTTFSCSLIEPLEQTSADIEAAQRIDVLTNRMFIEPLLGRGYPIQDLKVLGPIEAFVKQHDEQLMQFDMDFIGIQNYTREVVKHSRFIPYINAKLIKAKRRNVTTTTMDWEVYPPSIYHMLKKFSAYPEVKKLLVTENGAAFNDYLIDGKVNDLQRIAYLTAYLEEVLRAKKEGVPVDGYFAWSFTDNFEWAEGYRQRFGLVYVNYQTQRRHVKASGHWFREFLSERCSYNLKKAV
ncbi:MAG TPA: GH1 family beta-glucosidase [Chitinophagaceae bacterium]|nr:GH1 family beta-glucosidase [Chitinophagaceae bacterium]